jgi:hypothetical protein
MNDVRQPAQRSHRGSARAGQPKSIVLRALVALLCALSSVFGSSQAWAFPSARLEYAREAGAESCPDETALRKAVADRLGYDPFDPSAPELLRARVTASDSRFSAVLELFAASSAVRARRTLDSVDNCDELVAALALSMSIAIDPERSQGAASAPEPAAEGPAQSEKQPPPAVEKEVEPERASPSTENPALRPSPDGAMNRTIRIRAGASAHLAFGTEPGPAPGIGLSLGVRRASWSLTLGGRYDTETSQGIEPRGTVHARLRAAALAPCFHARPALLCGVITLGSLRARSTGLSAGRADSALFAAAGARLGVEWAALPGFALQAYGELLLTLRPLSAEVNEASRWSVPAANGLLAGGFIVEF